MSHSVKLEGKGACQMKDKQFPEFDNSDWPNLNDKCYDCGSTIPNHHTKLCDFAENDPENILDLPMIEGTQYWNKMLPDPPSEIKIDI